MSEERELVNVDSYVELVELVASLDNWLSRDGFLPDDWRRNRSM